MDLEKTIRDIPNFPKEGILFKDITTLLKDKDAFKESIDRLAEKYKDTEIDYIVGTEARGFVFAAPLAYKLGAGFIPVRKPGKLPGEVVSCEYDLEYGIDCLEIHKDAIEKGKKVLLVDDLLATGGTIKATIELVEKSGGIVEEIAFLIELEFLKGREKLKGKKVYSMIKY